MSEPMVKVSGEIVSAGLESLLNTIERVREQRDSLYAASVNPRRDAGRALDHLRKGDLTMVEVYLNEIMADLGDLAEMQERYTHG